jgi:hypothetical protein
MVLSLPFPEFKSGIFPARYEKAPSFVMERGRVLFAPEPIHLVF